MVTVSGEEWKCKGTGTVRLQVNNGNTVDVNVSVTELKPLGFPFVLGMNGIKVLGSVTIDAWGGVCFGADKVAACAVADATLRIDEQDFSATYDPSTKSWTAAWKWAEGKEPDVLHNKVEAYSIPDGAQAPYEEELERWIKDAWLLPYDEAKYGPAKGLIPLMAVVQRNKNKVRPVMDFREVNTRIDAFTAAADVCAERLREWRRQGENVAVMDLNKAYLQIKIDDSLWPYQTVVFKGQRYCLTRLGFGLNVAPLVMKAILTCVLAQDPVVRKGVSVYIDDIFVNEDIVEAKQVESHLCNFGLTSKPHERLVDGARVLGLRVCGQQGKLVWKRDSKLRDPPTRLKRREVFSYSGELVGHFPVCGWLRVATAFVKRKANLITDSWDEVIYDEDLRRILEEIVDKVKRNDPVRGW